MFGVTMESLILKVDAMQNVSDFLKNKNLKFLMLWSMDQLLKIFNIQKKNQEQ